MKKINREEYFENLRDQEKFINEGGRIQADSGPDYVYDLLGMIPGRNLAPFREMKVKVEAAKISPPVQPDPKVELKAHVAQDKIAPKEWFNYISRLNHCEMCPADCRVGRPFVVHQYQSQTWKRELSVLFVGDYPKWEEIRERNIFAGARGELLQKIIKAMQLQDHQYALTLAAKCPEPKNSDRNREMSKICQANLVKEIVYLRPKIVVALGALATESLLEKKHRLSEVHGQFFQKIFKLEGETPHNCQIVPIFHPDYLLINPKMKKNAWLDLQKSDAPPESVRKGQKFLVGFNIS